MLVKRRNKIEYIVLLLYYTNTNACYALVYVFDDIVMLLYYYYVIVNRSKLSFGPGGAQKCQMSSGVGDGTGGCRERLLGPVELYI